MRGVESSAHLKLPEEAVNESCCERVEGEREAIQSMPTHFLTEWSEYLIFNEMHFIHCLNSRFFFWDFYKESWHKQAMEDILLLFYFTSNIFLGFIFGSVIYSFGFCEK